MIVGTAGHIDHGKTSLVRALTGVDTDRLKEEKARGITIELGFAYWPRPTGEIIGFVDVPGHERLVHTMLAGATGIDFVLLVVAADDGVMPQTREHLAIIDLLGISRGIVALTKSDLASPERRAEVTADIANLLAPTALAGSEVVCVSATTGEGISTLGQRLDAASAEPKHRAADGRFRLAVDRTFSLSGAGTVVTGTVLSGRISVGDRVVVSPSGIEARVRSMYAQNKTAERGEAGQRCALALAGPKVETAAIHRGDVVLDPSLHAPSRRLDARLTVVASERKPIGQWMPVKLHHGSAGRDARVVVLSDAAIPPGGTDFVQLVLDAPLPAAAGDRFILRDISATRTVGGGVILDLRPPERHRRTPARRADLTALSDPDPLSAISRLLGADSGFLDLGAFARDRALPVSLPAHAAEELGLVVLPAQASRVAMLPAMWQRYAADAASTLDRYHREKPDLPGLGQERLRLALKPRLPAPVFASALARLVADGTVVLDRSWVRRPGHEIRFSDDEERIWARIRPLLGGAERFRPPRVRDISKLHAIDEAFVRRLMKRAARRGDVDEIAQDHFFLATTVIEMADIARDLSANTADGQFPVTAFRNRLDNGRKVAIQILEFFDGQGLTMRRGDIRRINPHKADLYSRAPATGPSGEPRDGGESSPVGRPDFKSGEGRETALGGFDSCLLRQSSTGAER